MVSEADWTFPFKDAFSGFFTTLEIFNPGLRMTFSRSGILIPIRHEYTRFCISGTFIHGSFWLSLAPSFNNFLCSFSWLLSHSTLPRILKMRELDEYIKEGENTNFSKVFLFCKLKTKHFEYFILLIRHTKPASKDTFEKDGFLSKKSFLDH